MKVNFTGHHVLLTKIDTDFYSGKFVPLAQRSTEHILPKSKGGKNNIVNYAMVERNLNSDRGNIPLKQWLNIHPDFLQNMQNYIKKYWDIIIDGKQYGKEIQQTLSKMDINI